MSDQWVMCVWQAVFATNPTSIGKAAKSDVCLVTANFIENPMIRYRGQDFERFFTSNTIEFDQYVEYVHSDLIQSPGTRMLIETSIEDVCWDLCKDSYNVHKYNLGEQEAHKLWKVFNRLCKMGTLPPSIDKDDANWIGEKLAAPLGQHWTSTNVPDSMCFCRFLAVLADKCFTKASQLMTAEAIEHLHESLVREVTMAGWMYMRIKKGGRWTWWSKYWFVLDPGHLNYYDTDKSKQKLGDIPIDKLSMVEESPELRTLYRNYTFRFAITSSHFSVELSAFDEPARRAWLFSLAEMVDASNAGTTPVQIILNQRLLQKKSSGTSQVISPSLGENIDSFAPATPPTLRKRVIPQKLPIRVEDEKACTEMNKIQDVLLKLDQDGDGCIDLQEFKTYIVDKMRLQMTDEEIANIFKIIDIDGNDIITIDEFAHYFWNNVLKTGSEKVQQQMKRIQEIFYHIDFDSDGCITRNELSNFIKGLGLHINAEEIAEIFSKIEVNKDGVVTFDEFTEYFMNNVIGESDEACSHAEARLHGALLSVHSHIIMGERQKMNGLCI